MPANRQPGAVRFIHEKGWISVVICRDPANFLFLE